jgi:Periplasmic binding protein
MRSLLRWLAAVPIGVAFSASGCNQISGVNDYEKTELRVVRPCTVNADCAPEGDDFICRKDTLSCVKLMSEDCRVLEGSGDYKNDDAFIFASLLPQTNSAVLPLPDGTRAEGAGKPLVKAMRVAVTDFADGLPPRGPGLPPRPLVMLECDDQSNLDVARQAARHVVDVGLPAILGPMFSGFTRAVANEVTIPGGVFTNSPTASASNLTGLFDDGLVWRMAPSSDVQGGGLTALMDIVEFDPTIRTQLRLGPTDPVKVASVFKGDDFGIGLSTQLRDKLLFNGDKATAAKNEGFYLPFQYGDPNNPAVPKPEYSRVVDELIAKRPHFVFLLGVEEINTEVLPLLEERWGNDFPRPFYLSAPGPYARSLFDFVGGAGAQYDVRRRVFGIVPGTNNEAFRVFRSNYDSGLDEDGSSFDIREADTSGPSHSYDAVYLLAFAAASLGDQPITGAALAGSMGKMVSGEVIKAGPQQLSDAFRILTSGAGTIDFDGASGPASFDLTTGDSNVSDMQIWCMGPDTWGKYSDVYYSSEGKLSFDLMDQRTALNAVRDACQF